MTDRPESPRAKRNKFRIHGPRLRRQSAIAALGMTLLLSACGSGGGKSDGAAAGGRTAPAESTVRFIWSPSAFGDWFAAKKNDFWAKQGVRMKPIEIINGGVAVMSSLASSSADMALVGDGPVVTALAEGLKLSIVGVAYTQANAGGLFAKPGSGITSDMHSLEGKTIATTRGSGSDIALHRALANAGVPASRVTITYIAPPDAVPVLERGQADGEWYWDTPGQQLMAAGAKRVVSESGLGIDANIEVIVVRPAFLKQHPATVVRALAAMVAGGQYSNQHPSEIASYMAAQSGLTPGQGTSLLTLDQSPSAAQMLAPTGGFSLIDKAKGVPSALTVMAEGLKAEGLIKEIPSDLESVIDTAPLTAAQKIQGAG
jgi:sulfonate transport system substrate-binding protein